MMNILEEMIVSCLPYPNRIREKDFFEPRSLINS